MPSPHSVTLAILIVEDDSTIAETLSIIFSDQGYKVRTASSAELAAELIRSWTPAFALIDVCLPGVNGVDFAVQLRAACPECRILLFSGLPESGELVTQAARRGHHFKIVAKPIYPVALLKHIADMLAAPQG